MQTCPHPNVHHPLPLVVPPALTLTLKLVTPAPQAVLPLPFSEATLSLLPDTHHLCPLAVICAHHAVRPPLPLSLLCCIAGCIQVSEATFSLLPDTITPAPSPLSPALTMMCIHPCPLLRRRLHPGQ